MRQPQHPHPVLNALIEAMVPCGGPFEEGGRDTLLAREIESFVAASGARASRLLRFALWLLECWPLVLRPWRPRRFSRLGLAERVRVLEAWERSRVMPRRQTMHALKLVVMTHFYCRPEIEARLGYPQPLERVPRATAEP